MKFENFKKQMNNDYYIVQNGIVAINDIAIYDVWSIEIELDVGEKPKICLYDMNNMLMASIDIDLIQDIDVVKRDERGDLCE